ncbi:MAG TPA: ubiquinone/menaquinone biosynthesis methyltransferase [Candidatus Thermoplasmatota archaeon]|nr:ubiquinone/menaquinone biosynthesis methyltransferase [Candidatus Thermoplasmatota archaeon]
MVPGPSEFRSREEKEAYVQDMFDAIAPRYDRLNRIMAMRLDQRWRRQAARAVVTRGDGPFLDVGAGTGDLALAVSAAAPRARVLGLDVARRMLALGLRKRGFDRARMGMTQGSGLAIPARDGQYEGITNAFVLRNLSDLDAFFREAHRALRPGGRLVSLEIGRPRGRVFGPLYRLYFFRIVPRIGRALSGSPQAYSYLADSVQRVEEPGRIAQRMRAAGFADVRVTPIMRGAVNLFVAQKA